LSEVGEGFAGVGLGIEAGCVWPVAASQQRQQSDPSWVVMEGDSLV
jgi:hypothetical protein